MAAGKFLDQLPLVLLLCCSTLAVPKPAFSSKLQLSKTVAGKEKFLPHDATNHGVGVDVKYSGFWEQITTFPRRQPFATALITGTVKTTLADVIVQLAEMKPHYDFWRTCVFTVFGFLFQGVFLWNVYIRVFMWLCPRAEQFGNLGWEAKLADVPGQVDLVKQVCLDVFVVIPFFFFPTFHIVKELVQGSPNQEDDDDSGGRGKPRRVVARALARYRRVGPGDVSKFWMIWIPVDIVIYSCPVWMRLPLNHLVSFLSTSLLSILRGAEM